MRAAGELALATGREPYKHWTKGHDRSPVSDADIAAAMRTLFECTHQVAEGAGAAALAAAMTLPRLRGRHVAVILSGGNVDRDVYAQVLREQ